MCMFPWMSQDACVCERMYARICEWIKRMGLDTHPSLPFPTYTHDGTTQDPCTGLFPEKQLLRVLPPKVYAKYQELQVICLTDSRMRCMWRQFGCVHY